MDKTSDGTQPKIKVEQLVSSIAVPAQPTVPLASNNSLSNKEVETKTDEAFESDEELDDGNFVVEKIIKHRIKGDKTEYFLKWKGYPDSENTWEKAENIFDSDMVETYWKNPVYLEGRHLAPKEPTTELVLVAPNHPLAERNNWDSNVRNVETITKDLQGELVAFLIWKDGIRTCHPLSEANLKCPQKLLNFYEKNIFFKVPSLPF